MLGALVCLVDAVEIFALNMTYDVPVKLFSFHLVIMSLFLLAPEFSQPDPVPAAKSLERRLPTKQPEAFPLRTVPTESRWQPQVLFGWDSAWRGDGPLRQLGRVAHVWRGAGEMGALWHLECEPNSRLTDTSAPPLLTDYGRWRRDDFRRSGENLQHHCSAWTIPWQAYKLR